MIKLKDVIRIDDPAQYKLHLACRNEDWVSPLDEYVTDDKNWLGWNEWRGNKNDWTRDYVFSLMAFYPRTDAWLFGGVFKVIERNKDHYVLQEIDDYKKYVGRVILTFHRYQGMRGRAYYLENYIEKFEVSEILPNAYSGESFPGYENICHEFNVLEPIFKTERSDWKAALSSVKGVYLISDKSNGKKYVGSAYGGTGIWSRWACYIGTGHGWNDELTKLINERQMKYARENFRMSILEIMTMSTPDDAVISRESHWKNSLLSKSHGYNKN
ncbi:MAG: GIY-YIG nuclease family protein [Candidatus Electrothrix sp. Rat3]|nr:GIY-YIG nuclease family protein [Candidatus Electrothrix rattekaaiensis]